MKYIKGFGYFWYDFIVGDSIVLAIGGVGALALAYLFVEGGYASAAEFILPVIVIATLVVSLIKVET